LLPEFSPYLVHPVNPVSGLFAPFAHRRRGGNSWAGEAYAARPATVSVVKRSQHTPATIPAPERNTNSYDAAGNLTNLHYPSSGAVKRQFDSMNRVTNMLDGIGTTVYTYTAGGQLLTEDGPFASDTVTNTYVNRMRVALGLQQPSGNWTKGWHLQGACSKLSSVRGSCSYT
jgi:hypothetical protein